MENKTDNGVKVGDKFYKKLHGEIKEYQVSRVGRKYFYLKGNETYPIDAKDLTYRNDKYSQWNFRVYRTVEEILDIAEQAKLFIKIRESFNCNSDKYTLDQLRDVYQILNHGKQD